jgi:cysteinyl-tRNA synthetase
LHRLLAAAQTLGQLKASGTSTVDVAALRNNCYAAMNDDFNSPITIAHLFDGVKMINSINDGKATINAADLELLKKTYNDFVFDILGLKNEDRESAGDDHTIEGLMQLILDIRKSAKANKDWPTADKIRDNLTGLNIEVKDTKEGAVWNRKE